MGRQQQPFVWSFRTCIFLLLWACGSLQRIAAEGDHELILDGGESLHSSIYGAIFSKNDSHLVVTSAPSYDGDVVGQGKLMVFAESSHGSRDWEIQYDLTDEFAGHNSYLGFQGVDISAESQYIVSCAPYDDLTQFDVAGFHRGKCVVFCASSPGAYDWQDQQVHLYNPAQANADRLGYSGPVFSADGQHIIACADRHISNSICIVFSLTDTSTDWNETAHTIFDTSGATSTWFGTQNIPTFSSDSSQIIVCDHSSNSNDGLCVLFTESGVGLQDWQDTQQVLGGVGPGTAGQVGLAGGANFSPNGLYISACGPFVQQRGKCTVYTSTLRYDLWDKSYAGGVAEFGMRNSWGHDGIAFAACSSTLVLPGKCVVFVQSAQGAHDWNDTQVILEEGSGIHDWFGHGGAVFSSSSQHILVCAYGMNGNQGFCYIFSESLVGHADWDLQQTTLTAARGQSGDQLGYVSAVLRPGGAFTNDSQYILICAPLDNQSTGTCTVFKPAILDLEDQCVSSPCMNGGTCTDGLNDYSCACVTGTEGKSCLRNVDDCVTGNVTCLHGGLCYDDTTKLNAFNCTCDGTGFAGDVCEVDVDDCGSNPCFNGTCTDDGSVPYSFNCSCAAGFNGTRCNNDYDDCISSPCSAHGICVDTGEVQNNFTCVCERGYTGLLCTEDVDDCAATTDNPCMNNGTCTDDGAIPNDFNCTCLPGYNGTLCEGDINDCDPNPCDNDGTSTCTDLGAELYECKCLPLYSGDWCEIAPSCLSNPCAQGGVCTNSATSYTCACVEGTTGITCEVDIDECVDNALSLCELSGTASCVESAILTEYNCTCLPLWSGVYCQFSEERTFHVILEMPIDADIYSFALTMETDLQVRFATSQIKVMPQESNATITVFDVVFLVGNVTMDLPTKTELTQVVADANYAGIVVRGVSRETGFEDTDSDDAENTVNWMTSLLPIIVLILAGLIIMVLTIYCVYRVQSRGSDKIKAGSRYRMPR